MSTPPEHDRYPSDSDPTNNRGTTHDADPPDDAEYSLVMDYPDEADYYALLGLSRSPPPNDAEIRSAYRTLTLSFHPDKQPAEWHEAAAVHFARIREAYETLIDPRKRTVYDLLGAEGVRQEWGPGGVMGRGGDAERQLGVRAQSPEEFRRWFLESMKRRERRAVNSLVQSRGALTVGINASSLISYDAEEGETHLHIPSPSPSSYRVGYTFKAPVPTLKKLLGDDEKEEPEEEGEKAAATDGSAEDQKRDVMEEEEMQMTITASVGGPLKRVKQKATITHMDGTTEERKLPLPPILVSEQMALGAGVTKIFGDVSSKKGIFNWRPFSFLSYTGVSVNAGILPAPSLRTNVAKAVTLVPGTKPFSLNLSTTFNRSLNQCPPSIGLQLTKQIGERKHAVCNWSSGTLTWPEAVQEFFNPLIPMGIDIDSALSAPTEMSQFSFAIMSSPRSTKNTAPMDDEDDEEDQMDEEEDEDVEYKRVRSQQRAEDKAAEAWQVVAAASPQGSALSFMYARNIFSGTAANDPARSEWSSEGHYPLPPANEPRSVRVEVRSTLSLDMSLGWSIEGTRQVGEFTRMGVGVGVEGARGIVMTVSWNRLGQRIRLPIAVCPIDAVNADSAALAILFPWVAYCALEFGFIRPRERKKRRRVIARRQKELKKFIPKKRAESQQAIELMRDQVQRRQAREEKQDGLVITKAEYVPQPLKKSKKKTSSKMEGYEAADVTIPVAALVDRGQLVIPPNTTKFHIIGFHDPAPLLPKTLKIWYRYHGKEHYVEATDAEGVACPMRSHLVG
ncbi:DnaJ domain protein [Aspergillus terreus]|uniref:DnaJ domain protein n=1 Tax=Aspergillus terreus TaxID=33178 RepID=A0A5M3YNT3_ASPTE|nr:hypothetical protein ATETN484_0002024300 [Aspergillus terreus]GFF15099.1 DnaJ domain protein [Aspergillus terreus]